MVSIIIEYKILWEEDKSLFWLEEIMLDLVKQLKSELVKNGFHFDRQELDKKHFRSRIDSKKRHRDGKTLEGKQNGQ